MMIPEIPKLTAPAWPAAAIEMRDPRKLKPNSKNPRKHSAEQIKEIRASIDEFGWTQPAVIDARGRIWGGHGRVMAALVVDQDGNPLQYGPGERRPEPIDSVPVVVARNWSEEQKIAYMLADNQIGAKSEWDRDLLREHLNGLKDVFDLALAGFDAITLPQFLAAPNPGSGDPDAEVEPPAAPVVRLGDIWTLGTHRIICGDSTDKDVVTSLLAGAKPHLMVTDPPYGIEYDANWRNKAKRADGTPIGAYAIGEVKNDDRADWREAWALFPGDVAYVWHAGLFAGVVAESLIASRFDLRSQIIWAKQQFAIGRGDYHWQHEPCWYAVRKGRTGHYVGGRKQTTVWEIDKPQKSETGHSTQKPVECMARPIRNNSKLGDAVYEPFSGSGTTIIAGEMTGRHVYAVEFNPAYVQMAVERWQAFTGKSATLDGVSFEQVKVERSSADCSGARGPAGASSALAAGAASRS